MGPQNLHFSFVPHWMLLLLAQGLHSENHCSGAPLKISDKWAQPSHCWGKNRSLKEVGPPAVALSLGLKSHFSACSRLWFITRFGWDYHLRGQKEDPLCLLVPHFDARSPPSNASCHLESLVSNSPSLPAVGKEITPVFSEAYLPLYAMEY